MNLQKNIQKYYFFNITKWSFFALPILFIYMMQNGLNYTQIMFLASFQAIAQLVLELPTGIFADYIGRKYALALGGVFRTINALLFLIGNSFWPYFLATISFGISMAFESGADTTLLYDSLKDNKKTHLFKKIEGKAYAYGMLSLAISSLVGGLIANFSLKFTFLVSAIIYSFSIFIALSIKEPIHHKKQNDYKYFHHLYSAMIFALKHSKIRYIMFYSGLLMSGMLIGVRVTQPYFQSAKINISLFGIIYFFHLITGALASLYAHKIEKKLGQFLSLTLNAVFIAISFIYFGLIITVWGIFIKLFEEFSWGFTRPLIQDYIHKNVESNQRATILSLNTFWQNINLILLSPIFGYIADLYSFQTVFLILGLMALFIGIPIAFMIYKQ